MFILDCGERSGYCRAKCLPVTTKSGLTQIKQSKILISELQTVKSEVLISF